MIGVEMPDSPESRFAWGFPWIVERAVDFIEAYLQPTGPPPRPPMRVFEWGSGGSTTWFAERVDVVHTTEHRPEWASALRALGLQNVVVHEVPSVYPHFGEYASAIDDTGMFDVILIDGDDGYDLGYAGSRRACAQHAIDHAKPGGLVILDNAGSASNIEAATMLEGALHNRIRFVDIILDIPDRSIEKTETSVFVVPS